MILLVFIRSNDRKTNEANKCCSCINIRCYLSLVIFNNFSSHVLICYLRTNIKSREWKYSADDSPKCRNNTCVTQGLWTYYDTTLLFYSDLCINFINEFPFLLLNILFKRYLNSRFLFRIFNIEILLRLYLFMRCP